MEINPVSPAPAPRNESERKNPETVDSGLSSIEKSKAVIAVIIPSPETPELYSPSTNSDVTLAVETLEPGGKRKIEFLNRMTTESGEKHTKPMEMWSENLREIERQVKELLASPNYRQIQELRQGESDKGISGISASSGSNGPGIVAALDYAKLLEKIYPERTSFDSDGSFLVLPLAASILVTGQLTANPITLPEGIIPLGNIVEFIAGMQPILPHIDIASLVSLVNLMIAAPILYRSREEAVNSLKNRETDRVEMGQRFAKEVIKIVTDSAFDVSALIREIPGFAPLSGKERERISAISKFILTGVALSLLYAGDVGKIHGDRFGGMLPEELRDLLNGTLAPAIPPNRNLTIHELLTLSLIQRAHEQLAILSTPADKILAVSLLLDYIDRSRQIGPMTRPDEIFREALDPKYFSPGEQGEPLRG